MPHFYKTGAWGLIVFGLLHAGQTNSAEITVSYYPNGENIQILGPIAAGDTEKLNQIINSLQWNEEWEHPRVVQIASPGGDLVEAMKMGRLIRSLFLMTEAPNLSGNLSDPSCRNWSLSQEECICASACFFVWVAGAGRSGGTSLTWTDGSMASTDGSTLAIHRASFDKAYFPGLSAADADKQYNVLIRANRDYLSEMDVPTWVSDKMLSVPSGDIHFLTKEERMSIGEFPPAIDEWLTSRCGQWTEQNQADYFDLDLKRHTRTISPSEADELRELINKLDVVSSCLSIAIGSEQEARWPASRTE